MTEPEHGTVDGFRERRCDCDDCLRAYLLWRRERRIVGETVAERNAKLKGTVSSPHGGIQRYQKHGCRCELCRAAAAKHRRDTRARAKERAS